MASRFGNNFKRFFLRGLAALLPTVLTIVIIVWAFSLIQQYFGDYINKGMQQAASRYLAWRWDVPVEIQHGQAVEGSPYQSVVQQVQHFWDRYLFWFGFLMGVLVIYIFGRFLASFLGRVLWRFIERGITQFPIFKQIYPYVKQVTDFLLAERKMQFSRVVAVEYPRKSIWSIGLVTNPGMATIQAAAGEELLTVFIPSSPTPFTGYTITVKRSDVIDLPISIDEALRYTVTGGVIQPLGERTGEITTGQSGPELHLPDSQKEKPA